MAVCGDIFLFSFCLLDTGGLIFILIYFIITLSDLECDYLNAQECCSKLNFVRNKEYLMRLIKNISFSFAVERAQIVVSISDFVHLDYRRALANVPN